MRKFLINLWRDEGGAAAAEYALILAVLAAAIATGAIALGTNVGTVLNDAATCVATPNSTNC